MRVLVTGGAGYIGSHTARALSEAGHEPIVLDDLSLGHREAVRFGPLVSGDIADAALVKRTITEHRIEGVIHFAAFTFVGESVRDPRKYFHNNVEKTLALLDALVDVDCKRIVFSSSAATYGEPERLPLSEDHPLVPVNPYGESKLMVEKMLRWYGEAYGLRWSALRYFNACGAHPDGTMGEDHDPETHLVPLAIKAALGQRGALDVFGADYPTKDGTAVRDYVHVCDLADAHVRALKHLADGGASMAMNLGTGNGNSVREVIDTVSRVVGTKVPERAAPRRAGDPPSLVADPKLAMKTLGWEPKYLRLDDTVETAVRWHRR